MTKRKDPGRYQVIVDAEIDLHGMTVSGAREALRMFIDEARANRWRRVRVIVGKGIHSPNGPVLPDAIKSFLRQNGYVYTTAKIMHGGSGALEVMF